MVICIAGKNNVAVEGMKYLIQHFSKGNTLLACTNKTDDGVNGWQPSYQFFCNKNNIKIVELHELYEIEDLLFISLEYDRLLRPAKFKTNKIYNIHFSLLPAYKGMFTSVLPLIMGEKKVGVTLHKIDTGIDTGDIVSNIKLDIFDTTTARDIYNLYLENGIELFKKSFQLIYDDNVNAYPQPSTGSTYYSKTSIDFRNININFQQTAWQLHNNFRAFIFRDYQLPMFNEHKIYKTAIVDVLTQGKPGTIATEDDYSIVLNTIDYQVKLYKDKEDILFAAAKADDVETIEALHHNGFPINTVNKKGWDIAIVATYNGSKKVINYLLQQNWNINTKNYKGTTLAMYTMDYASRTNDLSLMQLLFPLNPDLKAKDDADWDIFMYAKKYANATVIEFLKDCR